MFTMIYKMVGYMGPDFRYLIKKLSINPLVNKPRNEECEDIVVKYMNFAVIRMYAEKYLNRTAINGVCYQICKFMLSLSIIFSVYYIDYNIIEYNIFIE